MSRQKELPSSRLRRLGKFGGLVGNVVANMALDGAKELGKGRLPKVQNLLLTPKNIANLAERLAQMRGAAMKMGQILSMDAGDLLPPELTEVLAILRDDAYALPDEQLQAALTDYLGADWQQQFSEFEHKPFAAASIGQVHKATLKSGEKVAVKLQYPGVAKSIHSDVDNMGTLMKMSGLVPSQIDMTLILLEVKMQLIREADYVIEAKQLNRYREQLAGDKRFRVPMLYPELCNERILTMSFEAGQAIETIIELPDTDKNTLCAAMLDLLFKEMFEFKLMQTDPNFANFMFDADSGQLVLLDFGATREIDGKISDSYKQVAKAILDNDLEQVLDVAIELGFYQKDLPQAFRKQALTILEIAAEPMQLDGDYDFGNTDVLTRIREAAMVLVSERKQLGTPPGDTLFMHRKIGGMFLLLMRCKAKLNLRRILEGFVG